MPNFFIRNDMGTNLGLAITTVSMVFLSTSRQMPGVYLDQVTDVSFSICNTSLFTHLSTQCSPKQPIDSVVK